MCHVSRAVLFMMLTLVLLPLLVSAHSAGVSLEKNVGAYVIDIGYDPAQPKAGDRLIFDFNLVKPVASTSVPFDYVWVRLESEGVTMLATGIAQAEFGPTSLLFAVPRDITGDVKLLVRYQKGDESLAEADFVIPIEERPALLLPGSFDVAAYAPVAASVLGGLIAGFWLAIAFTRRKKPMI